MKLFSRTFIHRAFQIGILLKGFNGVVEIAGGTALLLTSSLAIRRFVAFLTHDELIEDPHDLIANALVRLSQHLSVSTQHFVAFYLLAYGVVKVGLAVGLLRRVLWSYPAALVCLSAFIIYQLYRFEQTHSMVLCLLTIFDIAIVLLIWREWQQAAKHDA